MFPKLSFWSTHVSDDSLGQIDRALDHRSHRLVAGLSVSEGFAEVRGVLVVSQGHGKFLRLLHVVDSAVSIPKAIREGCVEFVSGRNQDVGQLAPLLSDLAETQATVVEQLKCAAGKYLDRILAVAISDPGIWNFDFDGRASYWPTCDAHRLAELSGVTIVDAFPARDLAVSGNGTNLEALPLWMIFADRNPKLANQTRALLTFSDVGKAFVFPASDGLDAEVPAIGRFDFAGAGLLHRLIATLESGNILFDTAEPGEGSEISELIEKWERIHCEPAAADAPSGDGWNSNSPDDRRRLDRMLDEASTYLERHPTAMVNVIQSAIQWTSALVVQELGKIQTQGVDRIFISSESTLESALIDRISRALPNAQVVSARKSGVTHTQIDAVVAALLGLFHIDQMPANVPWLTGADGQRILGRLTPGRPSNWRQLVRAMADFQPAPMKLKDAI